MFGDMNKSGVYHNEGIAELENGVFRKTDISIVELQNGISESIEASRSSSQQKKDMQPNLKKCLILLGGFVNLYITGGLPFNMSVLFVEFLETFGRSKAETSLIQSVCTGTFYTGGLLSGPLVKKYGPKICGFIGGLLSFIGIFLSYFATSIIYLVFSIGLLAGAGFSLNIVAAFASVAQNFSGNGKVLAMAFVALGSGVGGLSLPLLLQFLTTEFQWRGCLMIISGIALHLCACAIVSEADDIDDGNHKNVGDSQQERKFIQSMRHCFAGFQILFKNKIFLVYCLALAICLSTFNTFLIFAIDYFQSKGFDRATAVWMYTTMNIVNTVFRFIPGILALNPYIPKLAIPSLFAATGTLSLVLLPFSNAFISNVLVLSLFGMSQGGSVTVISITTLSLVGDDNYETGFGYCLATVGIVNAVAGPISGMIRDVTGTYDYSVLAGAASAFCAFLILTTAAIVHVRIEKSRTYKISLKDEVLRISKKRTGILPWRRSFDLGFTQ